MQGQSPEGPVSPTYLWSRTEGQALVHCLCVFIFTLLKENMASLKKLPGQIQNNGLDPMKAPPVKGVGVMLLPPSEVTVKGQMFHTHVLSPVMA